MCRKPGESIQELAARIRQDAVTCDFAAIKDPLDEAMRTRFMCSVSNEAVLKALFKFKEEELTFAKAIAVAMETEEAAKVAKETVYGTKASAVCKVDSRRRSLSPDSGEHPIHQVHCTSQKGPVHDVGRQTTCRLIAHSKKPYVGTVRS